MWLNMSWFDVFFCWMVRRKGRGCDTGWSLGLVLENISTWLAWESWRREDISGQQSCFTYFRSEGSSDNNSWGDVVSTLQYWYYDDKVVPNIGSLQPFLSLAQHSHVQPPHSCFIRPLLFQTNRLKIVSIWVYNKCRVVRLSAHLGSNTWRTIVFRTRFYGQLEELIN